MFPAVLQELVWAARTTSSQSGVPLLSSVWPPITKPELSNHWMSWGHYYYYYTPTSVNACVCVFLHGPNQEFGRPDSSWQGEASAVCFGLLLKPLAESFQSSATVLRFCCWSVQAGGNGITPPNLGLLESTLLSCCQTDSDASSAAGIFSIYGFSSIRQTCKHISVRTEYGNEPDWCCKKHN